MLNNKELASMTKANVLRWTIPSNHLPVPYDPFPVRLQPQGETAMRDGDFCKSIAIKFGAKRATQTLMITPGTTTQDVMRELGLGGGYQIGTADTVYGPDENIFPRVSDGALIYCTSIVDAGV
jgi:hypothetical protein